MSVCIEVLAPSTLPQSFRPAKLAKPLRATFEVRSQPKALTRRGSATEANLKGLSELSRSV